jgi:hypothetical protein
MSIQAEINKVEKRIAQAEWRLNYLRIISRFRKVSEEFCLKRKLCTTTAKNGTLHCAQPAMFCFQTGSGKKRYVCSECRLQLDQIPDTCEWI